MFKRDKIKTVLSYDFVAAEQIRFKLPFKYSIGRPSQLYALLFHRLHLLLNDWSTRRPRVTEFEGFSELADVKKTNLNILDRLPTLIRSSVVYQFKCPGCHALYFGKTTRHLSTRCKENLGINKAGQKVKVSPSAIWNHINKSGHAASVEDFSVLDRANNDFYLLIHESLLILRDRPSPNSQQSSITLALF